MLQQLHTVVSDSAHTSFNIVKLKQSAGGTRWKRKHFWLEGNFKLLENVWQVLWKRSVYTQCILKPLRVCFNLCFRIGLCHLQFLLLLTVLRVVARSKLHACLLSNTNFIFPSTCPPVKNHLSLKPRLPQFTLLQPTGRRNCTQAWTHCTTTQWIKWIKWLQ